MSRWIRVKQGSALPADAQCVIVSGWIYGKPENGRYVEPCVFADGEFHPCSVSDDGDLIADFDGEMNAVTHWMVLPEPPR